MPRKQPPDREPSDWAELVGRMRRAEQDRRHNRPSQIIERHAREEWDSAAARVRYYRDRLTGKIPRR